MLVAQKKQQENIAEYVLYLFQIEDIVRSLNFDIEQIMEAVVKPNLPDSLSLIVPHPYKHLQKQILLLP